MSDGWIPSPRYTFQYLHFDFLLCHVLEGNFVQSIAPARQILQKGNLLYHLIPWVKPEAWLLVHVQPFCPFHIHQTCQRSPEQNQLNLKVANHIQCDLHLLPCRQFLAVAALHSKFFIQLKKIATYSGEFKLLVKISSGISLISCYGTLPLLQF